MKTINCQYFKNRKNGYQLITDFDNSLDRSLFKYKNIGCITNFHKNRKYLTYVMIDGSRERFKINIIN
jgi:hypothetical protein